MSRDERETPQVRQDVKAQRDAYVAGRDLHLHIHEPGPPPLVRIWGNVPARNPAFIGRDALLRAVRDALVSRDNAAVQALHGMGGVGKTQIAIEYTHRYASDYEIVCWLHAENVALLGEQFAELGADLGCAKMGDPLAMVKRAVLTALHSRDRWLLIFDNAEQPESIAGWLPGGQGHVLITSRVQGWNELAVPVEVGVLGRAQSILLLQRRIATLSETDADLVAQAVGDLPLALVQAAGYMSETRMSAGEYNGLLHDRAADILREGKPISYPRSLAAVTQVAFDELGDRDPVAADLVAICAFLASEPVPVEWFVHAVGVLPAPLGSRMADPVMRSQILAHLTRGSLVRVDPNGLVVHRLTQAIVRHHLPSQAGLASRHIAEAFVAVNNPGDARVPGNWASWRRLMPHLLALEPAASASTELRDTATRAIAYLSSSGDPHAAHDLARHLSDGWRDRFGDDDLYVHGVANILAVTLRQLGVYAEARELDEECLAWERRHHGDDHPSTLGAAANVAIDLRALGDLQKAREVDEETLARRSRVLGDDHPDTLTSRSNLARDLYGLGDHRSARELDEDTLERRTRILGADHPETLASATNLARDLFELGEHQAARELDEQTLARQRRVLGEDHPVTLMTANNLAADLFETGEFQAARELDEDTLTRRRRVLGDQHPHTRESAQNLAEDLQALGLEPQPEGPPNP
jgi:tetratricopeptide (TPR) repeat protein